MKKQLIALILMICLTAGTLMSASALSLTVDDKPAEMRLSVINNTTYVPLRAVSQLVRPDALITWENNHCIVRTPGLTLTACPGSLYVNAYGRVL